ncbi:ribosome-associated protein [Natranaerovirga pectinivora]|uniref:Ribosomal silencing factor RsfS n=1 Tax=Natranaerovirga pectinivora TaxID=682400 RepID=A0A4R3MNG3_9FIRM|nr:ribosome silencing factor [Natranaerovirga pectinivora]TCT14900.1 ribosome-associated protein [Natranaerovirga pectinivora]
MSDNSKDMVKIIYDALDDKKAEDIKVLDIRDVTVLADYFIIAHGNNINHVKTLIDNTEEALEKEGYFAKQKEGYSTGTWVLLDYGNVIIHIFGKEDRLFYDLERVWRDGKEINLQDVNN